MPIKSTYKLRNAMVTTNEMHEPKIEESIVLNILTKLTLMNTVTGFGEDD